jgi:hypothetical protein
MYWKDDFEWSMMQLTKWWHSWLGKSQGPGQLEKIHFEQESGEIDQTNWRKKELGNAVGSNALSFWLLDTRVRTRQEKLVAKNTYAGKGDVSILD